MPTINDFKPFAVGLGANVLTQAQYDALTTLVAQGFQTGTAQSSQLNKVWRQSSVMSAVLAQYAADISGQDSLDDGNTATLLLNLKNAVGSIMERVSVTTTGTSDAIVASMLRPPLAYQSGVPFRVRAAFSNTTATPTITFNTGVLAPKTIVKGNDLPLVAGDVAGDGHWLELAYDATLDKIILQNPAKGIAPEAGAKGGGTDKIFWENDQTMTTNYSITNGKNAVVAGPLAIDTGVTLTVPTGSVLTIV